MKNVIFMLALAGALVIGCSKAERGVQLKQGTPEYDLAKELSEKVSFLDPDSNKVLASSDWFKITSGELIQTIQKNFGSRTSQLKTMTPGQLQEFIRQGTMGLAEQKLLLKAAKEANITVSQAEVDSVLGLQYKNYGGEEKFTTALTDQGVDIEFLKNNLRDELMAQHHLEIVLAGVMSVSEEQLREAYQEEKATVRHILLMTREKSETEKQAIYQKMQDILARARKGEDFAELAKKYSEDPGSKDNGGLYSNFERGDMVKPFEDAAFSVAVGEISDIVETQYGYHIIKVIDRQSETRPFEQIRNELEQKVRLRNQAKRAEAYRNYTEKLKTAANFHLADLLAGQ